MIPLDPIGYAVNLSTGTVHTRYPGEHAGEAQRTRTEKGVLTLLDGQKPTVCSVCYPSPRYATPVSSAAPQKRRSGTKNAPGHGSGEGTAKSHPPLAGAQARY